MITVPKKKITVRCESDDFVLPCWPIVIPHLSKWEFVVHKSVGLRDLWCVSEMTSGMCAITVDDDCDNMDEATAMAEIKLAKVDEKKMEETMERAKAVLAARTPAATK